MCAVCVVGTKIDPLVGLHSTGRDAATVLLTQLGRTSDPKCMKGVQRRYGSSGTTATETSSSKFAPNPLLLLLLQGAIPQEFLRENPLLRQLALAKFKDLEHFVQPTGFSQLAADVAQLSRVFKTQTAAVPAGEDALLSRLVPPSKCHQQEHRSDLLPEITSECLGGHMLATHNTTSFIAKEVTQRDDLLTASSVPAINSVPTIHSELPHDSDDAGLTAGSAPAVDTPSVSSPRTEASRPSGLFYSCRVLPAYRLNVGKYRALRVDMEGLLREEGRRNQFSIAALAVDSIRVATSQRQRPSQRSSAAGTSTRRYQTGSNRRRLTPMDKLDASTHQRPRAFEC